PDGLTLASGSDDKTVRLWDTKTGHARFTLTGHKAEVRAVVFRPDGERVFGWDFLGKVLAWTVADGQPTDPANPPLGPFSGTVVTSPDGWLRAEVRNPGIVLIDTVRERQDCEERKAREPVNRARWHQQNATRAEEDRNWFAAAFPLRHLCRDRPDDTNLIQRYGEVLSKLGRWDVTAAHLAEVHQIAAHPKLTFQLAVAQVSAGDEAGSRH